ncbi:YihY/virulence factor BrkB family protein [Pontiella sp.]|uniref:YihY/virulence factor BrkB family protein n=1 Tax=Pontiella sp. TaxID=2837462 RepID=UPI003562A6FA
MANTFTGRLKKFVHFIQHDLWRLDLVHDTKLRSFGVEFLRVNHLVLKGVKDDNCHLHAAALTYSTLMALVPFLVILFSIAKAIGYSQAEESLLEFAADMPEAIQTFIHRLLEIVQSVNPAALGTVGGVIFLYIIFKLLSGIEESFNQIWGVHASRTISDKIRNYLSVLVIAPSLMLLANAGSAFITAYAGRVEWLGALVSAFMQLAPVIVLALAFVAIFIFLPNTRVGFRPAAIGGLTSAILAILVQFIILKFSTALFQKYTIYGSFASIPIFLFWLHLNWTILLFGAELAFAVQNRDTYAEEQAAVRASMISKLWVAYAVMQEAVRVFQGEEASVHTAAYARSRNIPIRLMNEVIEVLTREHLIGPVSTEGLDAFALLQAPEHVTAKKIYDLMIHDGSSPQDLGLAEDLVAHEVLAAMDVSLGASLDPITLRRFMEDDA